MQVLCTIYVALLSVACTVAIPDPPVSSEAKTSLPTVRLDMLQILRDFYAAPTPKNDPILNSLGEIDAIIRVFGSLNHAPDATTTFPNSEWSRLIQTIHSREALKLYVKDFTQKIKLFAEIQRAKSQNYRVKIVGTGNEAKRWVLKSLNDESTNEETFHAAYAMNKFKDVIPVYFEKEEADSYIWPFDTANERQILQGWEKGGKYYQEILQKHNKAPSFGPDLPKCFLKSCRFNPNAREEIRKKKHMTCDRQFLKKHSWEWCSECLQRNIDENNGNPRCNCGMEFHRSEKMNVIQILREYYVDPTPEEDRVLNGVGEIDALLRVFGSLCYKDGTTTNFEYSNWGRFAAALDSPLLDSYSITPEQKDIIKREIEMVKSQKFRVKVAGTGDQEKRWVQKTLNVKTARHQPEQTYYVAYAMNIDDTILPVYAGPEELNEYFWPFNEADERQILPGWEKGGRFHQNVMEEIANIEMLSDPILKSLAFFTPLYEISGMLMSLINAAVLEGERGILRLPFQETYPALSDESRKFRNLEVHLRYDEAEYWLIQQIYVQNSRDYYEITIHAFKSSGHIDEVYGNSHLFPLYNFDEIDFSSSLFNPNHVETKREYRPKLRLDDYKVYHPIHSCRILNTFLNHFAFSRRHMDGYDKVQHKVYAIMRNLPWRIWRYSSYSEQNATQKAITSFESGNIYMAKKDEKQFLILKSQLNPGSPFEAKYKLQVLEITFTAEEPQIQQRLNTSGTHSFIWQKFNEQEWEFETEEMVEEIKSTESQSIHGFFRELLHQIPFLGNFLGNLGTILRPRIITLHGLNPPPSTRPEASRTRGNMANRNVPGAAQDSNQRGPSNVFRWPFDDVATIPSSQSRRYTTVNPPPSNQPEASRTRGNMANRNDPGAAQDSNQRGPSNVLRLPFGNVIIIQGPQLRRHMNPPPSNQPEGRTTGNMENRDDPDATDESDQRGPSDVFPWPFE